MSRWIQQLTPNLSREKWSLEENKRLLQLYQQKQNHWKEISSSLEGRTDNAAKNQFFALMRKGLRKACRTIGFTSNTIKINGLKPKVLLDFFQLERDFVVDGRSHHVNIADFIHHYALSDLPDGSHEEQNVALVNSIMGYLTLMKCPYQRQVHGSQEVHRPQKAKKDREARQKAAGNRQLAVPEVGAGRSASRARPPRLRGRL